MDLHNPVLLVTCITAEVNERPLIYYGSLGASKKEHIALLTWEWANGVTKLNHKVRIISKSTFI